MSGAHENLKAGIVQEVDMNSKMFVLIERIEKSEKRKNQADENEKCKTCVWARQILEDTMYCPFRGCLA